MEIESSRTSSRILRLPLVIARTGLPKSTIYERIGAGTFPRQVSLGAHSVGWIEDEVDSWIAGRIVASRTAKD